MGDYRFLLIQAFALASSEGYSMRPFSGSKESMLMNYGDVAPFLKGVEWDVHPGPLATHNSAIETREEFCVIGAARLPIVRTACEGGKYNGIVLLGGGDPGFLPAREIGCAFGIPVNACANAQMHVAGILGNRFSVIDISEAHSMHYRSLVIEYEFQDRCASIRSINFPLPRPPHIPEPSVKEEKDRADRGEPSGMVDAAVAEAMAAIQDDGAEVIIIGCSAAFWLRPYLAKRLKQLGWEVPVLEGYSCAIELTKMMVHLRVGASALTFPRAPSANWRRRKVF